MLAAARKLGDFKRPVLLAWADDRFFTWSWRGGSPRRSRTRGSRSSPDSRTYVPEDQPERLAELIGDVRPRAGPAEAAASACALALLDLARTSSRPSAAADPVQDRRRDAEGLRAVAHRERRDVDLGAVLLDARDDGGGDLLGRAGADAARELRAALGEHAGIADEAREHGRDAHAGPPQLLARAHSRSRAARTWSRCRRTQPGARDLAGQRGDEDEVPRPRSSIPGSSARVSCIGARRFTSSARSICSRGEAGSRPDGRQRGVGDQDVDVGARRERCHVARS